MEARDYTEEELQEVAYELYFAAERVEDVEVKSLMEQGAVILAALLKEREDESEITE